MRQRTVTGGLLAGLGGSLAWWALTGEGDLSEARRGSRTPSSALAAGTISCTKRRPTRSRPATRRRGRRRSGPASAPRSASAVMLRAFRVPDRLEGAAEAHGRRGPGRQLPRPRGAARLLLLPRALSRAAVSRRDHQLHPGRRACSTPSPACSRAWRRARCCRSSRIRFSRSRNDKSGGLLTLGMLGTIWSTSSGVTAIIDTLNQAYDIQESRPWWKVRLHRARPDDRARASSSSSRSRWCWSGRRWPRRWRCGLHWARRSRGPGRSCSGRSSSRLVTLRDRDDLLLRARRRAGVDLDHARLGPRDRALAAHLARVQVLRRRTSRRTTRPTAPSAASSC